MKLKRRLRSFSFTTDLISEILLRLPEKSVVRFSCVSKLWLSITTDPYFINLYETRNPRPSLLICFKEKENEDLIVSSIPQQHTLSLDQNSRNSYSQPIPTHTYHMKFPEFSNYWFSESVHGLICLRTSTKVIVWNPSTSKFLTLPKPSKSKSDMDMKILLGYDPVEAKHKVIAMHSCPTGTVYRVITLGSAQESWRIVIKFNRKHTPYLSTAYEQCIKGVIYYLASTYRKCKRVWRFERDWLMRFDVRSEKLDMIQLPSDLYVNRLITYEGRLACVYTEDNTKKNGFTLSILEDAEENKWSSKEFPAQFCHREVMINFQLKGFTHAGEFIYEPYPMFKYKNPKSLYALFFDPVRNSFRKVGFKGIPYDEERESFIYIFPNHIVSPMSL